MLKLIQIQCPVCDKIADLELEPEIMDDLMSGILQVQIAKNPECGHSYLVYIDRKFKVRGYSKHDSIKNANNANLIIGDSVILHSPTKRG